MARSPSLRPRDGGGLVEATPPVPPRVGGKQAAAAWLLTCALSVLTACVIKIKRYGPINEVAQVFDDPQVLHRDMLMQIQHPTAGEIRL